MKSLTDWLGQILSKKEKPVRFKLPENAGMRLGTLTDRVVNAGDPGEAGEPYWNVVDLIQFHNEEKPWIRITYYRLKNNERLVFAGQTSATFRLDEWKRLLVQAVREKPWFRNLLEDVMKESKR